MSSVAEDLFDINGNLISYSHPLWNQLSKNMDGKVTAHSLYLSVKQDRHLWQTSLRKIVGKPIILSEPIHSDKEDDKKSSTDTDEGSEDVSVDKKFFNFDIPYREYVKMAPVNMMYGKQKNKKMYTVLKQGVWSNIINDWFIKYCSIPCNIIYKRNRVAIDSNMAEHFLNFSGKCKDCLAIVTGWAKEKPVDGMPLNVNIIMDDMNTLHQHTSKRPLNGEKRLEVGTQLSQECASNWRRHAVSSLTFGEKIPANVYNNTVLWKCKQSNRDKTLGITEKCPIMSLVELSHTQYAGSIHKVCAKPFIVHYWTPCQLVVYKSIRKTYVRLSVDATGSIVKKIKRSTQNIISSHIFLYEAVVSSGAYQTSVTQMISEKQDMFTIFSWLTLWMNDGVSAPQETVCDFSMALLGAITRAFCGGITVRTYVESCLDVLVYEKSTHPQLTCFVRIDIAHLIKMICRWKCWKGSRSYHLKDFFIR